MFGYKLAQDSVENLGEQTQISNPFNQVQRGGWLDLQELNMRGATPSGPVFGYKQAFDEPRQSQNSDPAQFSNPFNQKIRGANQQNVQQSSSDNLAAPVQLDDIPQSPNQDYVTFTIGMMLLFIVMGMAYKMLFKREKKIVETSNYLKQSVNVEI